MRPARVLDYVTGTIIALLVVLFASVTWRQRETDRRVDELRRPANTERKGCSRQMIWKAFLPLSEHTSKTPSKRDNRMSI